MPRRSRRSKTRNVHAAVGPYTTGRKKDPTDPNSEALDRIPEDDFYAKLAKSFSNKADDLRAGRLPATVANPLPAGHKDLKFGTIVKDVILEKEKFYNKAVEDLKKLRDANPDCPNVAKTKNSGCGTHFDVPPGPRDFPISGEGQDRHQEEDVCRAMRGRVYKQIEDRLTG